MVGTQSVRERSGDLIRELVHRRPTEWASEEGAFSFRQKPQINTRVCFRFFLNLPQNDREGSFFKASRTKRTREGTATMTAETQGSQVHRQQPEKQRSNQCSPQQAEAQELAARWPLEMGLMLGPETGELAENSPDFPSLPHSAQ